GEPEGMERVRDGVALRVEKAAARDDVNGDSKPRHAADSSSEGRRSWSSRPFSTDATMPYSTYSMPTGKKKSFGRKISPKIITMNRIRPMTPRSVLTLNVGMAGYGTLLIIRNARPAMRKRTIMWHG